MQIPLWTALVLTVAGWIVLEGIKAAYQFYTKKAELEHRKKIDFELMEREYRRELIRRRLDAYEKIYNNCGKLIPSTTFTISIPKMTVSEKIQAIRNLLKTHQMLLKDSFYISIEVEKYIFELFAKSLNLIESGVGKIIDKTELEIREDILDLKVLLRKEAYEGKFDRQSIELPSDEKFETYKGTSVYAKTFERALKSALNIDAKTLDEAFEYLNKIGNNESQDSSDNK